MCRSLSKCAGARDAADRWSPPPIHMLLYRMLLYLCMCRSESGQVRARRDATDRWSPRPIHLHFDSCGILSFESVWRGLAVMASCRRELSLVCWGRGPVSFRAHKESLGYPVAAKREAADSPTPKAAHCNKKKTITSSLSWGVCVCGLYSIMRVTTQPKTANDARPILHCFYGLPAHVYSLLYGSTPTCIGWMAKFRSCWGQASGESGTSS